MANIAAVRKLAMSFDLAEEHPHFEKTSFRVGKKIFATLDGSKQLLCVKFTLIEQSVFSAHDNSIIYPVPGAWGKKGYTYIDLKKVRKEVLADALQTSYRNTAPKKRPAKRGK